MPIVTDNCDGDLTAMVLVIAIAMVIVMMIAMAIVMVILQWCW